MHYQIQVPNAQPAGMVEVLSPYDGKRAGSVETIDSAGAGQALENMTAVFNDRRQWLPPYERMAILERAVRLVQARSESLIDIAIAEGGKPCLDTEIELSRAIDSIKCCIDCIRTERGSEIPMQLTPASMNRLAFTHRAPIGPVVAISAFNHPLNLIVHQAGPAIASGCPVIIKPARETPLSAFALADIFHEAGLPKAWCQPVVVEDLAVAEQLVTDKRVAFFSFIGSAAVGWRLRSKLAPGTRCALEHGGVAPVIIAEDANLDKLLPLLAKGGFYHAGQVCVSVQRVYAHRAIARTVAERLAILAEAMITGDPASAKTDIGPLIRHSEVDRIESWVNEALQEKATLMTGGKRLSDSLYSPTVLLNPSEHSKVSQKEIFGPLICVYEYEAIDDAINRANALPYAFQAAIATQNIDTALYAYTHLAASTILVNDHTAFRVDWMPFAGLRESGYGTGGIPYTYRDMQIEKMAIFHSMAL
ncbi:Acyl-CoA reductase-like NAD-dependent aldehyde dehydrogenase [Candidatus Methylobacter favarea]|uniref:Acyl-CoA reductase-like NAD-dependent aldehyde dehydrogenase n=1 Tax=Candidatus Methylobacter favarea TaxID=2707345 RepID=A0A8S0WAS2_9GAMM|nr:aldehyde dehydrogenase family protein [Candidatus Methylobacter favarea]CAA9890999.1 Acyl-CoA reductase-like NAD-dependent aldehyde dehydrogenase [Candidatus Methylobacter favarea]